ncbi:MAG: hypothetical protein JO002_01790 [Burkholderiaceae bacterium]|nr:hypothetical protein [Burkholderiaceae bacterium]
MYYHDQNDVLQLYPYVKNTATNHVHFEGNFLHDVANDNLPGYPQLYAAGAAQYYYELERYRDAEQALSRLRPATRNLAVWVLAATLNAAAGHRLQALDALQAARRSGQYLWKPYCQAAALYSALGLPDDAAAISAEIASHGSSACPTIDH